MRRLSFIIAALALTISACSNQDNEIAEQREIVNEVFDAIVWPDGYEQFPDVTRNDPNLDSLNTQNGAVTTRFDAGPRSTSEIRDDFNDALQNAGFELSNNASTCEVDQLLVAYEHPSLPAATLRIRVNPNSEVYETSAQLAWTVPSDRSNPESDNQPDGELPECPGD